MKKWLIIFIVLFLTGCKQTNKITIIAPQGSPAMTLIGLDEDDYAIDIVNGPDPLIAAFGSVSHDVIIAPTNLGAKLYQSKPTYQLAAVLVFGNYHLVSTQFTSSDLNQIDGKEIIVFGQNQTSDIIMKHLIQRLGLSVHINYVDSVQLASAQYLHDSSKIVMVAEPSLSKLVTLVPQTKSIDLQEIYQGFHEGLSYPQASLFVKSDLAHKQVKRIIADFEDAIDSINQATDEALEKGVSLGIVDQKDILSHAIEGSHLMLKKPEEVMESIETYLSIILLMNPNLIGGHLPESQFYWSDQS